MTNTTDDCSMDSAVNADALCTSLSTARRRTILRLVADRSPHGIDKEMLATQLAAVTDDKQPASVTDDERRRTLIELVHRDLPALADAGTLTTDGDGTVAATDHSLFEEHRSLLTENSPDEFAGVFEALGDERRRTLLSVLRGNRQLRSTRTIARAVTANELGRSVDDVSAERVDEVQTSLVHVHLPMLSDAGLIAYDPADGRVAYEGHPLLRNELDGLLEVEQDRPRSADGLVSAHT